MSDKSLAARFAELVSAYEAGDRQMILVPKATAREIMAALDSTAWCPIETAPKDGSIIQLAIPGRAEPGRWYEMVQRFHVIDSTNSTYSQFSEWTHWQSLPEPPEAES